MTQKTREWMEKKEFEKLITGKLAHPEKVLGSHLDENQGQFVIAYRPSAIEMYIVDKETHVQEAMECMDLEEGIFGIYKEKRCYDSYFFRAKYGENDIVDSEDCYQFPCLIGDMDEYLFGEGTHYDLYKKLGAHPMEIDGVWGTYFAVWAPHAKSVGVAGTFNMWDGRQHYMRKTKNADIFELFIPYVEEGAIYKYQITTENDSVIYKSDPYANCGELRPKNASVVVNINKYEWNDREWKNEQKKKDRNVRLREPMSIYEIHIGSWRKKFDGTEDGFFTYGELAPMVADYVLEMGYTHVELMGIAEHPFDGSWGYQVTGYFAPTRRYGNPEDFMYFVDYLHQRGIGVLLDWVPAHFPKDAFGLAAFDGAPLYEHPDARRGEHPHWGTLIFNYGKREVSNFLITNALYWLEKYHIDGLRVDAVASMLYLDYGKNDGEWLQNEQGGKENWEAVRLLQQLSKIVEERCPGAILIAEESTAWKGVTAPASMDGLGFIFKWNMGWMNDFLEYMKLDPYFKQYNHSKLIFSMMYAYNENFIQVLSHDEVVHGKGSMIQKMPGEVEDKFSNLKVAYGFMYGHPGKKLLFMGQEFAQWNEWNEKVGLDWACLMDQKHYKLQQFVKQLNIMYRNNSALYYNDSDTIGFEWMSCQDAQRSIVAFIRRGNSAKQQLLFVCNFTPVEYPKYCVGVPCKGLYTEILNSDHEEFGGKGRLIDQPLKAVHKEKDGKEYSVQFRLPPLSIVVFSYDYVEKKKSNRKRNEKDAHRIKKATYKY